MEPFNDANFHTPYLYIDEMNFMIDFTKIDDILTISNDIYHVGIIDPSGNVIVSKMRKEKTGSVKTPEEQLGIDLCIIKQIFDLGSDVHGKTYFILIKRENKQHLVHFLDNLIICVTCDSITSFNKISEISDKVKEMVGQLVVV